MPKSIDQKASILLTQDTMSETEQTAHDKYAEEMINRLFADNEKLAKKVRAPPVLLERFYDNASTAIELSIDEAGRGCLFGRVYVACVVLPKDPAAFDGKDVKDSKKFSSKKKLNQVAEYIKLHARAWHVEYVDEDVIDKINILQSVIQGMHKCIRNTILKIYAECGDRLPLDDFIAVVDGNYFKPFISYDMEKRQIVELNSVTVEQGDGKYMAIAAASILAKTARDAYVADMCDKYPVLDEYYGLRSNQGYGTKKHLDGIRKYGITKWHRKTYGCCNGAPVITIDGENDYSATSDDENEAL
jgi:ribonuclease HII